MALDASPGFLHNPGVQPFVTTLTLGDYMSSIRPRRLLPALLASLFAASAAHAAPHGILWMQGKGPAHPEASSGLQYYGGPVISNAKVYAVFWGSGVDSETQSKIGPFFANMLDSTYEDWLKEYNTGITAVDGRHGTDQKIGRGSFAGAITITPNNGASSLTDADLQTELDAQIAAGSLPKPDDNTLYMMYFPSGISISMGSDASCQTFCAYHEGFKSPKSGANVYYGVMPVCGFGCGFGGSTFDSMTIVSSHECTEAITDPFPTPGNSPAYPQAWNDSGGQEIGDLCAQGNSTVTGHGITSAVQWEWDNSIGGCAQGPWSQNAPSLAAARPASNPAVASLISALRENPAGIW